MVLDLDDDGLEFPNLHLEDVMEDRGESSLTAKVANQQGQDATWQQGIVQFLKALAHPVQILLIRWAGEQVARIPGIPYHVSIRGMPPDEVKASWHRVTHQIEACVKVFSRIGNLPGSMLVYPCHNITRGA